MSSAVRNRFSMAFLDQELISYRYSSFVVVVVVVVVVVGATSSKSLILRRFKSD